MGVKIIKGPFTKGARALYNTVLASHELSHKLKDVSHSLHPVNSGHGH
jgi:hypothetical protein